MFRRSRCDSRVLRCRVIQNDCSVGFAALRPWSIVRPIFTTTWLGSSSRRGRNAPRLREFPEMTGLAARLNKAKRHKKQRTTQFGLSQGSGEATRKRARCGSLVRDSPLHSGTAHAILYPHSQLDTRSLTIFYPHSRRLVGLLPD